MRFTALVATAFLVSAAHAQSKTIVCKPPQIPECTITGPAIPGLPGANMTCTCLPLICQAPQVQTCNSFGECSCTTPPTQVGSAPGTTCTVSVVYNSSNPSNAYIAAREPHCDDASIELGLIVALAKLLGLKP